MIFSVSATPKLRLNWINLKPKFYIQIQLVFGGTQETNLKCNVTTRTTFTTKRLRFLFSVTQKNPTQNRIHLRVVNVMEQRGVLCCLLLFRPKRFFSDEYWIWFHSILECSCTHLDDHRKHFWWHSMFTKSNTLTTHFQFFFLSVFAVYLFTSIECQTAHYWTMSRLRTALFRVANTSTDSGRLNSHESERQIGRRSTSNTNDATNKTKRNRSHTTQTHVFRLNRMVFRLTAYLLTTEYKWKTRLISLARAWDEY